MITPEILIALGFKVIDRGIIYYQHPFYPEFEYKQGFMPLYSSLLLRLDEWGAKRGQKERLNQIRSALGMAHAEF